MSSCKERDIERVDKEVFILSWQGLTISINEVPLRKEISSMLLFPKEELFVVEYDLFEEIVFLCFLFLFHDIIIDYIIL